MGNSHSKGTMASGGLAPQVTVQGTHHSPLPEDPVPYSGPAHEYRIVLINATLRNNFSFGFTQGKPLVTSDIESYFGTLQQQYADYYKMNTFFQVPYASKVKAFSATAIVTFQGILSRPTIYTPSNETWELSISQSYVQLSLIPAGGLFSMNAYNMPLDSNMQDIYNKIHEKVQHGARFLCMECSGSVQSQGYSMGQSPIYSVDLFFDVPKHPNPTCYTYIGYCTPMHMTYDMSGTQVQCDWNGTLAMHLDQGWRLADIFIAQQETGLNNEGHQHRRMPRVLNTLWFFEKEVAKMNDPTPRYQVTMIEYYMPLTYGFSSVKSDLQLGPLLTEMGSRGWELVCVLETPSIHRAGLTSASAGIVIFFQRPILLQPNPVSIPPSVGLPPQDLPSKSLPE